MRRLAVFLIGLLAIIFIASALATMMPTSRAIGLTLFGAMLAGLVLFTYRVGRDDAHRHSHERSSTP